MKKILPTLGIFVGVLAFFAIATSPVQAASFSFSPASGTVSSTTPITLTITLDTEGAKVDGADARIRFDPSKLQAVSPVTEGTVFDTYPAKTIDNTAGRVAISGIAPIGSPYTGSGTFATVQFRAVSGASGSATVEFVQKSTTESIVSENGTAQDVLSSVQNATLTIGTGTSQPTPTPIPGGGGTQPPSQLPNTAFNGPTTMMTGLGFGFALLGFWGLRRRLFA